MVIQKRGRGRPRKNAPGAGRPAYKPTPAAREMVEQLVSVGTRQDDIARVLGITTPTLVKHFEEELKTGAAKKRAEVIVMIYKAAKKGNVSAQKKLEDMTRVGVAASALSARGIKDDDSEDGDDGAPAVQEKAAPAPKRGKKEERSIAAEAIAGGEGKYRVRKPPQLVVNNK